MSQYGNVYLDNGTAVKVIRFDIGVTVGDAMTGDVLWSGDVPQHLVEHYSSAECAEWAAQWVDEVYGLPVVSQDIDDPDNVITFGVLGHSYVEQFRAGARYLISVTVAGKGMIDGVEVTL